MNIEWVEAYGVRKCTLFDSISRSITKSHEVPPVLCRILDIIAVLSLFLPKKQKAINDSTITGCRKKKVFPGVWHVFCDNIWCGA